MYVRETERERENLVFDSLINLEPVQWREFRIAVM